MNPITWLKPVLATLGLAWILGPGGSPAPAPKPSPTSPPKTQSSAPSPAPATKISTGSGRALPQSFFGVSVEYPELQMYDRFMPAFEKILNLWTPSGDGPLVLRVGGHSADRTYWQPGSIPLPPRAFVLTSAWFQALATLISQANLKVILDLNLQHSNAGLEAPMAAEAMSALPSGSVIGFEVGNEPDRYLGGWTPAAYATAFTAYAQALAQAAPGVPVYGPAVSNTNTSMSWLRYEASALAPQLGELDGHRYQLGGCVSKNSGRYPSVARMLSSKMTVGLVAAVEPAVQLAHSIGKAFRLDELNSVTCGGVQGVSNSFATALWAPDALFSLWASELDGVNVHIRADRVNGPLRITPQGFVPRPLFYGLTLFARAASPGGKLLPMHLTTASGLSGWVVQTNTGALHVILINKGSTDVQERLSFPSGDSSVTVQRLLAPSVTAIGGVTLAGQQLAPDGTLVGNFVNTAVSETQGAYNIDVPAGSAALVEAQP